ncbi:MAG: hypothetical protein ACE5L7_08365 [Candidatus Aminicenantales bacterium]
MEKVYLCGGDGGALELAGRTIITSGDGFFHMEKIDKQSDKEEEKEKR